MTSPGKAFYACRYDAIKLPFKFVIALLFIISASLAGAQTLQTLVSFNGNNGEYPFAALTLGNDGNFYGTTLADFNGADGTIFQVTTNGTLTTLAYFDVNNGANPHGALTLGTDGNFYGTTRYGGQGDLGGDDGDGTVFMMTTNGTITTLYSFTDGTDGAWPNGLTLGNDGDFYGTTGYGGSNIYFGTIFKVTTNGTLTTLYSFTGGSDGYSPFGAMTLGNQGNFYGTTYYGGIGGYGTIFQVTTNGALTTLVAFNSTNGAGPYGALTLGRDGNFYGTTYTGGIGNYYGTVFKVTSNGALTTLVFFNGSNGTGPYGGLTLGNDGNFYGTTTFGGSGDGDYGTLFKITTNGTLTTLVNFNGSNGEEPVAALTLGNDGNFYGTTWQGGNSNGGTVFCLSLPPLIPPTLTLQVSAGCPQLTLAGTLSNNFVVQYSTNLANPNWLNLLSVTNLLTSPYLFLDPSGVVSPARFYRAMMQ